MKSGLERLRRLAPLVLAFVVATPASARDPAFKALFVRPATTIDQRCRNAFLRLELGVLDRAGAAFRSVDDIQADIDAAGDLIESGCNPNYLSELRFCIPSDATGPEGSRRWPPPKLAAHVAGCLRGVEDRGLRAGR